MRARVNDDAFVAHELDKISTAGERIGHAVRSLFKNVKRFALVIGIVCGAGLIVFVWAVLRGMTDREKK